MPVVPDVVTAINGGVDAVVAGDGTLAYVSGGVTSGARTLVWVDRQGREAPIPAPSAQELFYVAPTGALMRVGVERAASWAATTPTLSVKEGYFTSPGGLVGRTYDIAPDGQRFLMIKEGGGADQTAAPPQIIIVQHWVEELKRLVPTN